MKLTDPQRRELERLAEEGSPSENRFTARGTSRVRNSLRSLGLVNFFNKDGTVPSACDVAAYAGHGSPYDSCEINGAGRDVLNKTPPRRRTRSWPR